MFLPESSLTTWNFSFRQAVQCFRVLPLLIPSVYWFLLSFQINSRLQLRVEGKDCWLGLSGKQSEGPPSDGAATKPEMRASTWPGEINAFHFCIYGSWPKPGLILTTTTGHQNTIMMAVSALERFRAEQSRAEKWDSQ